MCLSLIARGLKPNPYSTPNPTLNPLSKVKDEFIKYVDYRGDTPEQNKESVIFQISCFLNIAQCQLKMKVSTLGCWC